MRAASAALAVLVLLAGPADASRRVVLAVDGSGSMKDAVGTYTLGEALGGFIEGLDPADELALIVFDDKPALLRAPAPLGASASAAVHQVQAIAYDGQHSDLPAALAMACDLFPAGTDLAPVDVLLVTDGVVTVRPPRSAAEAITHMARHVVPRCAGAGARVHVIGLGGARANTAVLQGLAEATSGRSEFPLSASRLSGFLVAYIESTAAAPEPPAAPAGESAAGAPVSDRGAAARAAAAGTLGATTEAPPGGLGALVVAAVALLLAVLVVAWAIRRRRRSELSAGPAGLVTVRDVATGREHSLSLPATLGRSPSSPLTIDDKDASRRHFRLEAHEGRITIVDLGSSNGTFVNGTRLKENEPRAVRAGDKVKVPGLELIIQPQAMDADATYIRQDLDGTIIRSS